MAAPTGTKFPGAHDHFQAVVPGTPALGVINEMRAALNEIETKLFTITGSTRLVQSVTVQAGDRVEVTLVAPVAFGNNDGVVASVLDETSPPMLAVDGIARPAGTQVVVSIFNRDTAAAHTGRVCVHIDRA